jgi:hypothetical protein
VPQELRSPDAVIGTPLVWGAGCVVVAVDEVEEVEDIDDEELAR